MIAKFVELYGCDKARIVQAGDMLFLLLGWKRSTRSDAGQWHDSKGQPIHFDYVHEEVVASGADEDALIASAKEYKELMGLKWSEYFERKGAAPEVVDALRAAEKSTISMTP